MVQRVKVLVVSKFRITGEALRACLSHLEPKRYQVNISSCLNSHEIDFEPDIAILSCLDNCPAGADAIGAVLPRAKLIIISRAPSRALQAEWLKKGVAGIVDESEETFGVEKLGRALAAVQAGEVWAPRDLLSQIVQNGHAFPEPAEGTQLTPRQKEVLGLLHLGLSNADIGNRLCISEKTVKAHLTNIYRKLGVANRIQATVRTRDLLQEINPPESPASRAPLPCASHRLPIVEE